MQLSVDLVSTSYSESCARIVDDEGNAPLQCDNATALILSIQPGEVTQSVTFDFEAAGTPAGGGSGVDRGVCQTQGPGTCLQGEPFKIRVTVSNITTSYALQGLGLDNPFAYVYGNCWTPMLEGGFGPYADQLNDICGPTTSRVRNDWVQCQDPAAFPYIFSNDPIDLPLYTECAFACGWQKDEPGIISKCLNLVDGFVSNLTEEYISSTVPRRLACPVTSYGLGVDGDDDVCAFPDFPLPRNLCPCARSYTVDSATDTKDDATEYASITVCKNGSCQGTCGTALIVSEDTKEQFSPCAPDEPGLCINTEQLHRCLKCQPTWQVDEDPSNPNNKNQNLACYYLDLNPYLSCQTPDVAPAGSGIGATDFSKICGSGQDVYGGDFELNTVPEIPDIKKNEKNVRMCNCNANFVERVYWVAPVCQPFLIVNPPRVEFTIVVSFEDLAGNIIPGSIMTVGQGWNLTGDGLLPSSDATDDGFALTRILSVDSTSGRVGTELEGLIVVCNNGDDGACDVTSTQIDSEQVPSANLITSSPDGRDNPWAAPYFLPGEAKVPLPNMVYRRNPDQQGPQKDAWWYYVSGQDIVDYGRGCGQNGWANYGESDQVSANSMCNNAQGTCVPGIDTLFRGDLVSTPCSVAADFIQYWRNRGRSNAQDGTTSCGFENLNQIVPPPHVPFDWDPTFPNYWVDKGRLHHTNDPTLAFTRIRLEIAIAANFVGSTVTQGSGELEYVSEDGRGDCRVQTATGGGIMQVRVINTGTTTASYTLDGTCTRGLAIIPSDPFRVGVGAVPGTSTGAIAAVDMQVFTTYSNNVEGGPGCNLTLHPSLNGDIELDTLFVPCIASFGIPIISPEGDFNLSFGDQIGNFTADIGSACGIFDFVCNPLFNQQGFFTPAQITIITYGLLALLTFGSVILMFMCTVNLFGWSAEKRAYTQQMQKKIAKSQQMAQLGQEVLEKQRLEAAAPGQRGGGKQPSATGQEAPISLLAKHSDSEKEMYQENEDSFESAVKTYLSPERLEHLQRKFGERWEAQLRDVQNQFYAARSFKKE